MALEENTGIRVHVVHDERSASFLALGIGKTSRRPAGVLSTSGTAAANFHPAVLEAHHARVPLIVLTADRPPELRHTAANQTIDQTKLYGDAVRWFVEIGPPEDRAGAAAYWRSTVARAYGAATCSPAGPVHLNISFRDPLVPVDGPGWDQPLEGRPEGAPWCRIEDPAHAPSKQVVEELGARIEATERGVLVVGDCDIEPGPVLDLAEAAAWPVLAEPTSNARCGENAISTFDALLRNDTVPAGHRPDVVLQIGKPGLSRALSAWIGDRSVERILIDQGGAWLDPERNLSRIITGDPALTCRAVTDRLASSRKQTSEWLTRWHDAERRARAALDGYLDSLERPSEARVARDLAALAPAGAALVAASSMPVRDLNSFMAPRSGLRILGNRGVSGIDGFVSTALGVALAHPGPALALTGDLSLLHDQNGLLLLSSEDVSLKLVVVNNDGGGIFSFLPHARFSSFERLFGTPHGIDFSRLAAQYGLSHTLIEEPEGLAAALSDEAEGVHMIEVRTDRADNVAVHENAWRALSSPSG